jgi:hypothetical protein
LELSQQGHLLPLLRELQLEPSQQVPKRLQPEQHSLSRRRASLSESEDALWVRLLKAVVLQQPWGLGKEQPQQQVLMTLQPEWLLPLPECLSRSVDQPWMSLSASDQVAISDHSLLSLSDDSLNQQI